MPTVPINIKCLSNGQTLKVQVDPNDPILQMKETIGAELDITPDQQRLVFRGKTLKDDQKLADIGISKEATLHLVLKLASYIELNMRVMTGKVFTLEVNPSWKVEEVIAMCQELQGFEMRNLPRTLNHNGQRLDKSEVLSKYKIPNKSQLQLILAPAPFTNPSYDNVAGSGAAPHDPTEEEDRVRVYGQPGTLYARCGGIWGISAFVDRCMDKWMADATLNANAAVATWHERAQRCGFKFLVTQLMGYLCGGPQVYTGRDMAASHKHLNINSVQWTSFMDVLNGVCAEFGLPQTDVDDLNAVILSMMDDCVVSAGEVPPRNPGHPRPNGNSLYARIGGVYEIALFTDRLIDALLKDPTIKIPLDSQKRNEASLKYLFTELVCNAADGPETMTSTLLSETRLLASSKEFFQLLRCAEAASDHIRHGVHRTQLMQAIYAKKDLILDPARTVTEGDANLETQIARITRETTIPIAYIPGGGVVFFAGRENHFGRCTIHQQEKCWAELGKLGFRKQRVLQVKSVGEAAAGSMLSNDEINSRHGDPSAFIAAEKRVYGDPRTLYGRGGGVFGLSKLADRLMDVWMSNKELNDNAVVAKWHDSGQKFGFKFLVTQVFGYLTGGPQKYTGNPMDVAHKHLGITDAEWDSFMNDADAVFREFQMDPETHQSLHSILDSFKSQIVLPRGMKAPPDPGLSSKMPPGDSLYAKAGGVYPIARFCNEVIDNILESNEVKMVVDNIRTPAALKYLLTELICNAAEGPEVVTSKGFDYAKLNINVDQWGEFSRVVMQAAQGIWSDPTLWASFVGLFEEQKAELCSGLVQETASAAARKKIKDQGYGQVETTAALLHCDGDADKALALLAGGWKPKPIAGTVNGGDAPRCPFGFGGGGAKKTAGRTTHAEASRALGNEMQAELDGLLQESAEFSCPITMVLFSDPVLASDGFVYEKDAIAQKIASGKLSPMTHEKLGKEMFPVPEYKTKVLEYTEQRLSQLLQFSTKAAQVQDKISSTLANTALDRAKEYLTCVEEREAYKKSCSEYAQLCLKIHRPLSADIMVQVNPQATLTLNIRVMNGETFALNVNPATTVDDVVNSAQKVIVTRNVEAEGATRCLNFDGERLQNSKSLVEYKMEDQSLLQLILVPMMKVTAQSNGATKTGGYASKAEAVAAVKAKAQAHQRAYGQQGTLYARCGGIFGIAGFVDRCMDVWMSDPTLNANEAVATWHGRAQRCGFKFLVTQLMGYLCGGPQVYTGRDMATSHKHLNINSSQWASFMECLQDVCMEFQLPQQEVDDLTAVILSTMDDCIVGDGEVAPPNPGHGKPPGNSLYAQMGGVYPIALFADRLIDAMLEDKRISIPIDGVKRSAASLKYLFTELVCNITGGPEVITSPHLDETKVLLSSGEFFLFLVALPDACDHIPDPDVREQLKITVYTSLEMMVDPKRSVGWDAPFTASKDPRVRTHRQVQEALDQVSWESGCVRSLYIPGSGVCAATHNMAGQMPRNNEARTRRLQEMGFGGGVQKSSVKSSDAASRGGGERGA